MYDKKLPSNRSFGLLFFFVFIIIGLWPIINSESIRIWSVIISLIFFILGFLGLVVINSAQTDSADIIVADSTEEISEISDSTMMEEIPEDNVVEEQKEFTEENAMQETEEEETSVSQSLKLKFIEGGPLLCLLCSLP